MQDQKDFGQGNNFIIPHPSQFMLFGQEIMPHFIRKNSNK